MGDKKYGGSPPTLCLENKMYKSRRSQNRESLETVMSANDARRYRRDIEDEEAGGLLSSFMEPRERREKPEELDFSLPAGWR
jgi:hypothetical protein